MLYLSGKEEKEALDYIAKAAQIAQNATCQRSKCGSIIVKENEIIGTGYNSPPQEIETQRKHYF
jgi:deoxycytidylate deaminase